MTSPIWQAAQPYGTKYIDSDGRQWCLDNSRHWWLKLICWYRADSPAATHVLGVPVPGVRLYAASYGEAGMFPPSAIPSIVVQRLGMPDLEIPSPKPAAPPNIPPDFAALPPGPDCCRECHLNDTPLYEGNLCRYCWILAQQPKPVEWVSKGWDIDWPRLRTGAGMTLWWLAFTYMVITVVYIFAAG